MATRSVTLGVRVPGSSREFAELGRNPASAEELRVYHAQIAREVLLEEQGRGFDRDPRQVVDRRFDAPLESVKPFGKIEFSERGSLREVAAFVYDQVVALSPFLSGKYENSHLMLVNGAVATVSGTSTRPDLDDLKLEDVVTVVNVQPYARKIEGGVRSTKRSGRAPQSAQAPNGVYRVAFQRARKRYGLIASIAYTYTTLEGSPYAYALRLGGYEGSGKSRKKTYSNALNFFPAITIRATRGMRGAG
ncbi:hypothetical protein LCM08_06170 [Salipiger pacificus]|nr:hypothetical protein [Alloyangia pacifica]